MTLPSRTSKHGGEHYVIKYLINCGSAGSRWWPLVAAGSLFEVQAVQGVGQARLLLCIDELYAFLCS